MNNFKILISSPYDREHLVAEIWYEDDFIAEINQEGDCLEIQIYYGDEKTLNLPFEQFIET